MKHRTLYRRHFTVPVETDSTSDPFAPQATKAVADPPNGPDGSAPATTWEFTTFDKQGQDPLRYTVTLRPILQFGRRSVRYKGAMTHYERMIDNVLGVEGMEASVFVGARIMARQFQQSDTSLTDQYVQIFLNSARVYRSHDDPHDPVKATSAVLRKVLQDASLRIRRDVFGAVFGSIETMLGIGMSRFRGQQPFPFEARVGKQSESDSDSEAGKTDADNAVRVEPLIRNRWISDCWNADRLARLLDLGVDIGVWKVK